MSSTPIFACLVIEFVGKAKILMDSAERCLLQILHLQTTLLNEFQIKTRKYHTNYIHKSLIVEKFAKKIF